MKKILFIICLLFGLVAISFSTNINAINSPSERKLPANNSYKLPEDSKEELLNEVIVSFLSPYTQKAVDDFYSAYLKELPGADPNFDQVLSIKRVGIDILIKVETTPYIGPHNSVGRDHITFRVEKLGKVVLEKYEHIESSSILPQLYPKIIKKWPPK